MIVPPISTQWTKKLPPVARHRTRHPGAPGVPNKHPLLKWSLHGKANQD